MGSATAREERRQMRQRGAATHRTKEVNFSFSFGQSPIAPASIQPPAAAVVSADARPSSSSPSHKPSSGVQRHGLGQSETRDTRNESATGQLAVASTAAGALGERQAKRRKLDPSIDQKGVNTDGGQRLSVTEAGNSNSSENALQSAGSSQINDTGLGNDLSDLSNADQSHEAVSNVLAGRVSPRTHLPLTGLATRSDDRNPIKGLLSEHAANHRSPTLGPEKQRQKSVDRKDTTGQHMEPNLPRPKTSKAAEKVSPSNEQETQPTEIPHKRPRSKPSTSSRAEFDQKTDSNEHQQPQARDLQQASIPGSSKDRGTEKMASSASAADDDEKSRQQATVKKRRGRKSVVHSTPERDAETTRVSRERQRTSAHRTDKSITNPGPDGNETSQSQSNAAFMRHRRGRGQNSLSSRQAADDRNEQSSQHELDSSDISQQPKRRRGRPLPAQHATVSAAQTNESQASHEEASSESQSGRQESRSRGETVPITVHRLANVAALSQLPLSTTAESSDEDDRESLDELSTKEKTKFPSRGGVNPADVLSQICRETLEKAIATLSTGIANEANPARRTEFTRKKRAVQAFAAELEGRLFELSEILDSNFVLGVQCKKAKREMLDLRARLQQVRREREVIGLQLDAVRKKHADEENIKSHRAAINHSLHNLELALDRNHGRPSADAEKSHDDADVIPGLEFMLRKVAEESSSIAPGSHGGILQQIKAFNTQLEAVARRLEEN